MHLRQASNEGYYEQRKLGIYEHKDGRVTSLKKKNQWNSPTKCDKQLTANHIQELQSLLNFWA